MDVGYTSFFTAALPPIWTLVHFGFGFLGSRQSQTASAVAVDHLEISNRIRNNSEKFSDEAANAIIEDIKNLMYDFSGGAQAFETAFASSFAAIISILCVLISNFPTLFASGVASLTLFAIVVFIILLAGGTFSKIFWGMAPDRLADDFNIELCGRVRTFEFTNRSLVYTFIITYNLIIIIFSYFATGLYSAQFAKV